MRILIHLWWQSKKSSWQLFENVSAPEASSGQHQWHVQHWDICPFRCCVWLTGPELVVLMRREEEQRSAVCRTGTMPHIFFTTSVVWNRRISFMKTTKSCWVWCRAVGTWILYRLFFHPQETEAWSWSLNVRRWVWWGEELCLGVIGNSATSMALGEPRGTERSRGTGQQWPILSDWSGH